MTWYFEKNPIELPPDGAIGFVYIISNTITGKKYIGKKLFFFAKTNIKTVTLKNGTKKKKKIRSKIDSDWKSYYGSSNDLTADITSLGSDKFHREILKFCTSKNELSYYEAKMQFHFDVLLDESQWYNSWIAVKVRKMSPIILEIPPDKNI